MRLATALGLAAAAMVAAAAADASAYVPPKVTVNSGRAQQKVCEHPIYCDGAILRRVQLSGVFDKDKTFIDMPTRKPVVDIVSAYYRLPGNATKDQVAKFVDDNFWPIGADVVEAELADWTDDPPFLRGVTDPVLRGYGMSIHNQWKKLARRRDSSELCKGCESSLLPVNHTFIVPGDASSREFNYWQSYYINMGLLRSGLYATAKGALQNLLDMVAVYGFVPTGGRVYFTDRSELPLLSLMVKDYYEATKDLGFVAAALPLLKKEFSFWDTYRSISISYSRNGTHLLRRGQGQQREYVTSTTTTTGPDLFSTAAPQLFLTAGASGSISQSTAYLRPEVIMSDIVTSATSFNAPELFSTAVSHGALFASTEAGTTPGVQYVDLATAMIGPSLFSTAAARQLDLPATNPFTNFTRSQLLVLGAVDVNQTVSVNLNSILFQVETTIANLIELANKGKATDESLAHRKNSDTRRQTLFDLAFNPDTGLFADYNLRTSKQSEIWSLSSLWSYWAFADALPAASTQKALDSLAELHERFPGGLPSTFYNSTLTWDLPFVQSPLQHMAIQSAASIEKLPSLRKRTSAHGKSIAAGIAQSTLTSAFCNWYTTGGSINGVLNPYSSASDSSGGSNFGAYVVDENGVVVTTTDASNQGNYAWTNGVLLWVYD
ncbi:hypothetical protein LPJ61_005222, partial [Coemansia biformis]